MLFGPGCWLNVPTTSRLLPVLEILAIHIVIHMTLCFGHQRFELLPSFSSQLPFFSDKGYLPSDVRAPGKSRQFILFPWLRLEASRVLEGQDANTPKAAAVAEVLRSSERPCDHSTTSSSSSLTLVKDLNSYFYHHHHYYFKFYIYLIL